MTKVEGGGGSAKRSATHTAPKMTMSAGTAMNARSRHRNRENLDRMEPPPSVRTAITV
jgi:hypothetical protein